MLGLGWLGMGLFRRFKGTVSNTPYYVNSVHSTLQVHFALVLVILKGLYFPTTNDALVSLTYPVAVCANSAVSLCQKLPCWKRPIHRLSRLCGGDFRAERVRVCVLLALIVDHIWGEIHRKCEYLTILLITCLEIVHESKFDGLYLESPGPSSSQYSHHSGMGSKSSYHYTTTAAH